MGHHILHIVFAGGGTGGHLFGGLAVAGELRRRLGEIRLTVAGCGKPFERKHVEAAGLEYHSVACRPLPQRLWQLPSFLLKNLTGYRAACRMLRRERVDLVVGLGGYASAPVARAAAGCGVPLVLLEQNVEPGRVTRWLARSAQAVCVAFEPTCARLPRRSRVHVTGTPLRPGFRRVDCPTRRLLILGGSGGAASLNANVPRALYQIRRHLAGWEIVHQAGEALIDSTRALYGKFGLSAMVVPFLRNMPYVLSRTDVALARAGGSTLAELAALGVPAVLVPYPRAADNHQQANAEWFRVHGGCPVVEEPDGSGRLDESLAEALGPLVSDERRRERISHTIGQLGRPTATRDVADILCRLLGRADDGATSRSLDANHPSAYHPLVWEKDVLTPGATGWRSIGTAVSADWPTCGHT